MEQILREPVELTDAELEVVAGGVFDANGIGGEVEVSGVNVQVNVNGANNAFNG